MLSNKRTRSGDSAASNKRPNTTQDTVEGALGFVLDKLNKDALNRMKPHIARLAKYAPVDPEFKPAVTTECCICLQPPSMEHDTIAGSMMVCGKPLAFMKMDNFNKEQAITDSNGRMSSGCNATMHRVCWKKWKKNKTIPPCPVCKQTFCVDHKEVWRTQRVCIHCGEHFDSAEALETHIRDSPEGCHDVHMFSEPSRGYHIQHGSTPDSEVSYWAAIYMGYITEVEVPNDYNALTPISDIKTETPAQLIATLYKIIEGILPNGYHKEIMTIESMLMVLFHTDGRAWKIMNGFGLAWAALIYTKVPTEKIVDVMAFACGAAEGGTRLCVEVLKKFLTTTDKLRIDRAYITMAIGIMSQVPCCIKGMADSLPTCSQCAFERAAKDIYKLICEKDLPPSFTNAIRHMDHDEERCARVAAVAPAPAPVPAPVPAPAPEPALDIELPIPEPSPFHPPSAWSEHVIDGNVSVVADGFGTGGFIATGHENGVVKLHQTEPFQERAVINCAGPITALAWTPNGVWLAVADLTGKLSCYVNNVLMWSRQLTTDRGPSTLRQHITHLCWVDNLRVMACVDGVPMLCSERSETINMRYIVDHRPVTNLGRKPDGTFVMVTSHGGLVIWELGQRDVSHVSKRYSLPVPIMRDTIQFSPDGRYLAAIQRSDTDAPAGVVVYDLTHERIRYSANIEGDKLAFASDSNSVFILGRGDVEEFNIRDGPRPWIQRTLYTARNSHWSGHIIAEPSGRRLIVIARCHGATIERTDVYLCQSIFQMPPIEPLDPNQL